MLLKDVYVDVKENDNRKSENINMLNIIINYEVCVYYRR